MLGGCLLETENKGICLTSGLKTGHGHLRNLSRGCIGESSWNIFDWETKQLFSDVLEVMAYSRSGPYERVDCTRHKCRSNHSDTLVVPQLNMSHVCGQTGAHITPVSQPFFRKEPSQEVLTLHYSIYGGSSWWDPRTNNLYWFSHLFHCYPCEMLLIFHVFTFWILCYLNLHLFNFKSDLFKSHFTKCSNFLWSTYNDFSFIFIIFFYKYYLDPLQRLNLSPPVKAHAFVTLGKLHQSKNNSVKLTTVCCPISWTPLFLDTSTLRFCILL